eukprot:2707906-Amphidinium_carterae.1
MWGSLILFSRQVVHRAKLKLCPVSATRSARPDTKLTTSLPSKNSANLSRMLRMQPAAATSH